MNTAIEPASIANQPLEERINGGRPTKYTRESVATILRGLRRGYPTTLACEAGGICVATFNLWRKRYGKFDKNVRKAMVTGIQRKFQVISECLGSKDEAIRLSAAKWALEHCSPEHFSRQKIEVTGADGAPLTGAVAIYLPRKDGDTNGSPVVNVNPAKELTDGR
jgi:hypothetical protein